MHIGIGTGQTISRDIFRPSSVYIQREGYVPLYFVRVVLARAHAMSFCSMPQSGRDCIKFTGR